ncbi:equilibrative nucleoside transporter 1-like isoform X1 [Amphiura filiformis]|uniref:equilibrative nucleoside transporter 1-like isoform X1 n=1 Tax=Amphiura filiformis TaxID=82378 RepID=UPI003B223E6B
MAVNGPIANSMDQNKEDHDSIEEDFGSSETDALLAQASVTFSGKTEEGEPPPDRYWKVYLIFYTFGMCSVLPWNMFITADTYFDHKLRNVTVQFEPESDDDKTQLQTMYESYFSVAAQVPNVLIQIVNTGLKHKVTLQVRMLTSLSGMLILFIATTVLTQIHTDDWQSIFFYVTLISIVLINCCGALFQGSIFGLAGVLPKKYTQAIMAGQGLGGILPALISIISIAAFKDPNWSGFVYFLCAVIAIVITVVAYVILPRLEFASYYLNKQNIHLGLDFDYDTWFSNSQEAFSSEQYSSGRDIISSRSFELKTTRTPPFLAIFKKIWIPAVLVMLVFLVTLGCFPGATSQIDALNWKSQYFTPVTCFLLFNSMDFVGRSLPGLIHWPSEKQLWLLAIFVIMRAIFFPLFAFCNIQSDARTTTVIFDHDAWPILFMTVFAFTNGYLGSLCMMYGPKKVGVDEHMETAGQMMALFLVFGLAFGSLLSVPFVDSI